MITFTQFLAEARMAPLYHGTNMMAVSSILRHNEIMANSTQYDDQIFKNKYKTGTPFGIDSRGVKGVSLTRQFKVARFFSPIVFELDQQKLTQRYKIYPINYWNLKYAKSVGDSTGVARQLGSSNNEYEEFVVGDIKPLDKYLTAIWVNEDVVPPSLQDHPKLKTYPGGMRIDPNLSSKRKQSM